MDDASARTAKIIIERILSQVRNTVFTCRKKEISFTFSAGIANCKESRSSSRIIDKLIELADERMYQAKRRVRNRVIAAPTVMSSTNFTC